MNEPKFKVGQKVKVAKSGWGIHDNDVGAVVEIIEQPVSRHNQYWDYKVKGDFPNTEEGGETWAYEQSFVAIAEDHQEGGIQFHLTRNENGHVGMVIRGNLSTYQIKIIMDVALGPKEQYKTDFSKFLGKDYSQA